MSAATAAERGRRLAESLMVTTCTITRAGGDAPVWDAETGTYTPAEPVIVYVGKCKVQDNARSVTEVLAGERRAAIDPLELHLPIDGSGDVRRGDVARIDSNPLDPALVGREFVVQAERAGSFKTARRLPVEVVV